MVPVIVGANDHAMAVSPAQTKDGLFALFGPFAAQARRLYDPKGDTSFANLLQAVIADQCMIEPSRNLAELTAKSDQPVYFYRFSYVPEGLRGELPGALHGSEILFAFDAVSAMLKEKATKGDLEMGRTMSGYWAAFVKTGNPNGAGRPEWSRYDPASRDVLNFTNHGVTVGPDPLKERLDLWRAVWERGR